ncbi:MAG TPA: hypothetical protein VGM31_17175 [Puia sp.]
MIKKNYGLLFILSASLLLSLMYTPRFNTLTADKEIFRYIGRVLLRGGVPYRDVFDHKPPLIFFLNYTALLLGGDWGQWLIDTGLALLATALFFRLCKRRQLPFPWLLPLLFNLMIRDHLMCLGMGMTREYTTMFLLIFFCILMGRHRYRHYFLGLTGGLIFFMQQDQVLALLPFFLYAFLPGEDPSPAFRRFFQMAAGFLSVALPVILYFARAHALHDFWNDAFAFNFKWYTTTLKESGWDHWRKIKSTLDKGNYELPSMVALVLGMSALFFRHRNKRLLLLSLAAVLLSISTEFMGGRDLIPDTQGMSYTHYFLPLSASLPILLFSVFAFTEEPVFRDPKTVGVYGVLLCTSLLYTALQHGTHRIPIETDLTVQSPELNYLRQRRPKDYELFEFGNNDFVYAYNEFGIVGPGRWVYQHFWELYADWDKDHAMLRSIEGELLRHRTKYIVDFACGPGSFRDKTAFAEWQSFLRQYYNPVTIADASNSQMWRLKGLAEQR